MKPAHSYSESDLEILCPSSDHARHVLKMFYGISCLENIMNYNTFFDEHVEPWISDSLFELDLLCSKSEKLVHVLKLFFRNYSITCLETLFVINTYFGVNFERMKRELLVLRKKTLISDLNKYMSCTYDPGILMFVLSIQDKQVQPQKSESIDRAHQPEIWSCMYLRKKTSKLQGSFCPKFSFIEFYMSFKLFLSESFLFDTCKMDLKSNHFQEGGNDAPRFVDQGQDDATMVETDISSTKDKPGWINGKHTDLSILI